MTDLRGTNIASGIVPFTDLDSYASHYAKYGNGGWRTVESYEDLDAITNDRLEKGMAVYVTSISKVYILTDLDLSTTPVEKTWTELETGGDTIQVSELPRPSEDIKGVIVEYIGETESGEPEPIITLVNTHDDCEVSIDNSDFRDSLAHLIGITVEELDDMSFDLRFHYYANKWWLYDNQLGSTQDLENNWGMTLDYGTGSVHTNDRIYIDWLGNRDPYIVNGYFYQVIDEAIEDGYFGEVTNYTDEFVVNTDIEVYRQFIENQGRILVDMTYQFTYDGRDWLLNNINPVDLRDYGLEVDYNGGRPTQGDSFTAIYNAEYSQYVWSQKDVQNISNKIDKLKDLPRSTESNEGLIVEYVGETTPDYTNGYFYQSSKVIIPESYQLSDYQGSPLDEENPYELNVETYKDYIHHEGGTLEDTSYSFEYSETNNSWIDTTTQNTVDIVNDYGVTLHYQNSSSPVSENYVCTSQYFSDLRSGIYVDTLDINTLEHALGTLPTEPTYFCWETNTNRDWYCNGSIANPADYGITIATPRAPSVNAGDTFTVVFYPEVTSATSEKYLIPVYQYYNKNGSIRDVTYINRVDITTFESLITNELHENLPTKPTSYRLKCIDERRFTWSINGSNEYTSADIGIVLNDTTYLMLKDEIVLLYVPASSDESYTLLYSYFNNSSSSVESLSIEDLEQGLGTLPDAPTTYSFYCIAGGTSSTSKWSLGNYSNPISLSNYGITLSQSRAEAFTEGDSINVLYMPAPGSESGSATDGDTFKLSYTSATDSYEWIQKDVQPSIADYNDLENRPAIDGVTLTSETTAEDLSGSFVDLVSDQTVEGTKIINELYKAGQELISKTVDSDGREITGSTSWFNNTFLTTDNPDLILWMTSLDKKGVTFGFDGGTNVPAFGYIQKSNGELVDLDGRGNTLLPINPDPSHIARDVIQASNINSYLGPFTSNVVEYYDQRQGKTYLFAMSENILVKIDKEKLNATDYLEAAVSSYQLYDYTYLENNKIFLNRLRVVKGNIFAFQEGYSDLHIEGGFYPVVFDIENERAEIIYYQNIWKAGDYGNINRWGFVDRNKASGHDYQVVNSNDKFYAYYTLSSDINPLYDSNNTEIYSPQSTIYKTILDRSNPNCECMYYNGFIFNARNDSKCEILKLIKLSDRYLLAYSLDGIDKVIYVNLFDTTNDTVVARNTLQTESRDYKLADDYTIIQQSDTLYKVLGFCSEDLYQLMIDTQNLTIDVNVYYSGYLNSDYSELNKNKTIALWGNPSPIEIGRDEGYIFTSPVVYAEKTCKSTSNNNSVWMGYNIDLVRYATQTYVDSMIETAGYATPDDLNNLYENITRDENVISYYNLSNKPQLNGYTIEGNKSSQYYGIVESYGINITDTQMVMNGKAIKYDTPFYTALTSVEVENPDYVLYSNIETVIILPSSDESNVYYLLQNGIVRSTGAHKVLYQKIDLNSGTANFIYHPVLSSWNELVSINYEANGNILLALAKVYSNSTDPSVFQNVLGGFKALNSTSTTTVFQRNNYATYFTSGDNLEGLVTSDFYCKINSSNIYHQHVLTQYDSFLNHNVKRVFDTLMENTGEIADSTSVPTATVYIGSDTENKKGFKKASILTNYKDFEAPNTTSIGSGQYSYCTGLAYDYWTSPYAITYKAISSVMLPGAVLYEVSDTIKALAKSSSTGDYYIQTEDNYGTWDSVQTAINLSGAPFKVIKTNKSGMEYVAIDIYGNIDTSSDGVSWGNTSEAVPITSGETITGFCYVEDKDCFIVVTSDLMYAYSFGDLSSWSNAQSPTYISGVTNESFAGIACNDEGFCVALANSGWIYDVTIDDANETVEITIRDRTIETVPLLRKAIEWYFVSGYGQNENNASSIRWKMLECIDNTFIAYTNYNAQLSTSKDTYDWSPLVGPRTQSVGWTSTTNSWIPITTLGLTISEGTVASLVKRNNGTFYFNTEYINSSQVHVQHLFKSYTDTLSIMNNTWYSSKAVMYTANNAYNNADVLFLSKDSEPYIEHGENCYCGMVGSGYYKYTSAYTPYGNNKSIGYSTSMFVLKGDNKIYLAPIYDMDNDSLKYMRNKIQDFSDVLTVDSNNVVTRYSTGSGTIADIRYYLNTGSAAPTGNQTITDADAAYFKGSSFVILFEGRGTNNIDTNNDTRQIFGYTVHDGDRIYADKNGNWKLLPKVKGRLSPTSGLIPLTGDFDNAGVKNIEKLESHGFQSNSDYFYFYCLITDNNDVKKAYKSPLISLYEAFDSIPMTEISTDLMEQSLEEGFQVDYNEDNIFVYSSNDFYLNNPGVVSFKGDITSLYDPTLGTMYTSNFKTGEVVDALDNSEYRYKFTKPTDYSLYYYKLLGIETQGDSWENGTHTSTVEFEYANNTTEEVEVTFEVASHRVAQIINVSKKSGNKQLELTNDKQVITLENPNGSSSSDNATIAFTCESTEIKYLPTVEKFGLVKHGVKVEDAIENGAQDTNKVPSVKGMVDYVTQHSGGGSASSTQVTLLSGAANWPSNTQTISNVAGVTASNTILVAPIPTDTSDYTNAGILCSAQGNGTLTFTCTTVPSSSITVNVLTIG